MKIFNLFRVYNLYNFLRSIYLTVAPKGTDRYRISHSILSVILKHLRLYNITYQEWIRQNDLFSRETINMVNMKIEEMRSQPTFSIIMPVYNPKPNYIDEAIQSVINQVYPFWELCIADDASTDPSISELLLDYARKDSRIKVVIREVNGHISAASNSALRLATKDFIALLDHDDIMHPMALYYAAQMIDEYPDSEIIFSDEDKIIRSGKRLDPYFKPDFNYELLLSHNMVSHLGVYRTSTVKKVGGFRLGLEGSQDYDLLLRVIEQINPENIHHIPFPLYHWRISKLSVAEDINIKPYAIEAAKRAILEHLQRLSVNADVNFLPDLAAYNVDYQPPDPPPGISLLIIPGGDAQTDILKMLRSIVVNTTLEDYQIFLCLPKTLLKTVFIDPIVNDHRIRIIEMETKEDSLFASEVNDCMKLVSSEYICLINGNITGFKPGWLYTLLGQAVQSGVGAVAPKLLLTNDFVYSAGILLLPDGTIHHNSSGEHKSVNGYFGWSKIRRGYSALSEKCLLFKKVDYQKSKGFDESLKDPLWTGIDFCLSLRKRNLRNVLCPDIELYINPNKYYNDLWDNQNGNQIPEKLFKKWKFWFNADPAFNRNLKVDHFRILPRVNNSK